MRKKGLWKKSASVLIVAAMLMTSVPVYAAEPDEQVEEVVVQEQTEDAEKEAEEILLEESAGAENDGEEKIVVEETTEEDSEELCAVTKEQASVEVFTNGQTTYYTTLSDAVAAVADGTEILVKLLKSIANESVIWVNTGKNVTVNLNGYNVGFAKTGSFYVQNGTLTVTGSGKLYEQEPDYAPIVVRGNTKDIARYSVVNIGENVTLEGWSGIFVSAPNVNCADGVVVNIDGKIRGKADATGDPGCGVYVNGAINRIGENIPDITLESTSSITSPGDGIYAAGHANWTLQGDITAATALSIKSGIFDISSGTYHSTGVFVDTPVTDNSGPEDTGAALNITSNDGYAQKTDVTITGGTFISDNGYAVYEGIAKSGSTPAAPAAVASYATLSIEGGFFKGNNVRGTVSLNEMENKGVISGGYFNVPFTSDYIVKDDRGLELLVNQDSYQYEYGYVVGVRKPTDPVQPSSSNNNLSALTISKGTLTPAFDKDTTSYTATVDETVDSITVTPVTEDSRASIQVNGKTVASGKASEAIALQEGENIITVVVTAQNGEQKTYTIKVTRNKAELGSNANLAGLALSKGTLSPKFSAEKEQYKAVVENVVDSILVTPKAADENSTVTVNGKPSSEKVALKVGYNTIKVKVVSADGKATKTYTIQVTRVVPKNKTITISRRKYKVTNELIAKASVAITGLSDNKVINLSVPDTIQIYGVTYKVTSIGKNAFRGQPKMKTAKIGNNVTAIGYGAFYACPILNSVTVGKSVKTIGNHAFCRDTKLRTLTFQGTALTKLENHLLYQVTNLTIKAPSSKVKAYKKLFTNKGTNSFKVVKK